MSDRGLRVAQVAYNAGFRNKQLIDWVALALAESGGDNNRVNLSDRTQDASYGLWQINYYGNLAQSRTEQFGPATNQLDPQTNANTAWQLSAGGKNYSPWQADFNNGSYYKNLPEAQSSVADFLAGKAVPPWPLSTFSGKVSALAGGPAETVQPTPQAKNDCVIDLPGGICLWKSSYNRAVLGGLLVGAGGLVMLVGIALVFADKTGVANIADKVPGGRELRVYLQQKGATQRTQITEEGRTQRASEASARRRQRESQTIRRSEPGFAMADL